jgi:NAD(P)-dependent dehydrogenase (short-subunit alcohol dehydrogenase family)
MRLKDKIGIVTAAGSGMGRAGAIRFAKEGAKVAVVDLDGASVDSVVKEITAAGGKAIGITVDLRDDTNARRLVRETANAFGGLDFVWNHLGHLGHPGPASVEGIDMADFALAVDLNLRSQIVTTEAALPELKARGGVSSPPAPPSSWSGRTAYRRRSSRWRSSIRTRRRWGAPVATTHLAIDRFRPWRQYGRSSRRQRASNRRL